VLNSALIRAKSTYFVYDGTVPVAEMGSSGNVTAVNTFGANGLLSRHANGQTTFYTFDPQGSVAQRLNSSGTVLSSHMFDAYGLELSSPATGEPFGLGAQFGEQTDRETGLVLMTHRYYDPHLARFLTRDPSSYTAGLNLYEYAGNNPASYTDPDGHFWFLFTGAAGAGLGAIVGGGIAWWHGDNIWVGAGKGFLLGGIAGVTGGLAGEAVAGWLGGSAIANGAISGFAGGVVGDSAQQGAAMLLGWRPCFSIPEALAAGAVGGVLGGAGGWWAQTRGATAPQIGPIKAPLDPIPYEPHPLAARLSASAEPGDYVYVRDTSGDVHIAPDGPHVHPRVLGGGQSATGAGTLTIAPGGAVTSLDNISGTFQFGADTLPGVAGAIERQGLTVAPGAIRPFQW
jgi:RHS repeat-associated protein